MARAATVLNDIIEAIDLLEAPTAAKDQFKRLVRRTGAIYGVSGMAYAEQIEFARRLIQAKVSRATIRDRLMARFEISRSKAYQVIHDSLNCPDN